MLLMIMQIARPLRAAPAAEVLRPAKLMLQRWLGLEAGMAQDGKPPAQPSLLVGLQGTFDYRDRKSVV